MGCQCLPSMRHSHKLGKERLHAKRREREICNSTVDKKTVNFKP